MEIVMEQRSRKIPVTDRQFLWVQDDDKGEVTLHVGPTMVSPTAADRVVIDDGEGGFREDLSSKPQKMVELGDNQYAVLFNPLSEAEAGTPNGRFRPGRNESRPLRNGTRQMIPGPASYYLRPGQRADVRDAHELASNQYLVVKVYGEVDRTAPYYEVTARSAAITRATAENLEDESLRPSGESKPVELKRGQLIVIRGLDTQFYIPPTGVDIVPDTSVDASGAAASAAVARQLLAQLGEPAPEPAKPAPAPASVREAEAAGYAQMDRMAAEEQAYGNEDDFAPLAKGAPRQQVPNAIVNQSARARHRKSAEAPQSQMASGPGLAAQAPVAPPPPADMLSLSSPALRRALEKEARQARLIRHAVVLGEKEYCVIIDADGKREIKVGPARVFPGPYDTFMTVGSRNRVYDAYELLPQRALWLRVIAPISRDELTRKLPRGFKTEKDHYYPGDELLLQGVSTFFVPFNEIEVLLPETGQAVVGNDHERVFIEAIGIDQKSGIYVRDLATGEVRLVRGKQSYLVDPRKEVQITRNVPAADWNLWVAANEPHKRTNTPVTTPWALSIQVPNNTAVLITAASSRRVVEGPCVELLGYEESLYAMALSTGTPKQDSQLLRTCFLRTVGNRVSDVVVVETADFVKISVHVSYSVTFMAEHKDRWFNHDNYIQVMVDHLRSLIRGRVRAMSLSSVWPQIHSMVRDTILGEKKEGQQRPGRVFSENGTIVTEVEVLSASIEAREVAELMQRVQTQSVTLQIGDRQAQEQLASAKLHAEIDAQSQELAERAQQRASKLKELVRKLEHERAMAEMRESEMVYTMRQQLENARSEEELRARLAREAEAKMAELKQLADDAQARATAQRLLSAVQLEELVARRDQELRLIQGQSAANVAERQAVQQGLIEAMTALGDKLLMAETASNMNLVSLFKGKDVGTILAEVLGGTRVVDTLQAMRERYPGIEDKGEPNKG
jgi:major vault protein